MRRNGTAGATAALVWLTIAWSIMPWTAGWCGSAAADEIRPSWTCLPEGVIGLARIPQGQAFIKALRSETRLGTVLFDPARLTRISTAIGKLATDDADELDEFKEELAKYNLKIDDWAEVFAGDLGFALVLQPRASGAPLPIGLTWLEPGGDLSTRLLAALDKGLEETKDEKNPVRRIDFELAGQQVIHLSVPLVDIDVDEDEELPDFSKMTRQEREEWREKHKRRAGDAKEIVDDYLHFLVAKLGNRLLLANTFGSNYSSRGRADDAEPVKPDETAGVEEVKQVFAQFLAAHGEKGDGTKVRMLEAPGLLAALPGGLPAMELVFDPRPLVKLLDTPDAQPAFRMVKALAIDQLGPVAYRLTLEKNVLRGGLFVSAPAPRAGLLSLFDQPAGDVQPPAWVPADVIQYAQLSFDLGAAYTRIKELVIGELGDEVRPQWGTIEGQFSQFMNTDIATLLSSIGTRHMSLSLAPTKTAEADATESAAALMGFYNRSALVWQLKDEELWKRVLQMASVATGHALVEEQGFQGLRFEQDGLEVGVFLGRGYLTVGTGKDVCEGLLANLRNPPAGPASLAGSGILEKANELLRAEPGITFSVTDATRHARMVRSMAVSALKAADGAERAHEDESVKYLRELVEALLPSEQELDGLLGVGVAQAIVTEHGLVGRGAQELPAP